MKICWKVEKGLPDPKNISFHISVALIILSCCCYQGDEARPVSVSHVNPITCHVNFEKTHRRHVTKICSCKCWVWCKNSEECRKWSFTAQTQLLQQHPIKKQYHIYNILATECSKFCDKDLTSSILYEPPPRVDFKCNTSHFDYNSYYCDNHPIHNWCCSFYCSNEQNIRPCWYIHPSSSPDDLVTFYVHGNSTPFNKHFPTNTKVKEFLKREKRNSKFQLPYHIQVLDNLNEFTVHQPFNVRIQLIDEQGTVVPDTGRKVELKIFNYEKNLQKKRQAEDYVTTFLGGKANFSNISFTEIGNNYRLTVVSSNSSEVLPWQSEKLTVNFRPLILRSSGRTLPINPKESDTLSPAAGVIIYDEMDNKPASKSYLSQFTFEGTISLLYPDVYPGQLLGTTEKVIHDGSNEIIFDDIVISSWGYSYVLKIEIKSKEHLNLTYNIGPFDVDKFDTFELPLVESDEFRNVKIVFDNQFEIIKEDEVKFKIFFLNQFGIKYSKVRWKNITLSQGSIIVDSIITGLTDDLEKTSAALEAAIENDKAIVVYERNGMKANKIFLPSRKLLGEDSESSDDGGGLSVAWIVAIVVNVVLIIVFIIAIVYCYCRRKKKRDISSSRSTINNFDGGPNSLLFGNKAEAQKSLQDKAAIFTVEDGRAKLGDHRSLSGKIHRGNERCNCQSPTCYCSVGDGRQTEMTLRHSEEENIDDPQGYPTPSPEPKFPSPEPSPEPEDFWRPDSYTQQEEPEEDEEMFLPGAVSDPSPEPLQEERFYVYVLTHRNGSRELVGQIYLKADSFLSETRRAIDRDRELLDVIEDREYVFLDENLVAIPTYQESSIDLERIYSSQSINIQYFPPKAPTPKPHPTPRKKVLAYVGPLGICTAADCTKAAKIKCLDCRNVAYCSKKCMREDIKDHKKSCFKPAWRL